MRLDRESACNSLSHRFTHRLSSDLTPYARLQTLISHSCQRTRNKNRPIWTIIAFSVLGVLLLIASEGSSVIRRALTPSGRPLSTIKCNSATIKCRSAQRRLRDRIIRTASSPYNNNSLQIERDKPVCRSKSGR